MNRPYEQEAKIFCEAIKKLAENQYSLENLEIYLSLHFKNWLYYHANNPINIASELSEFSKIRGVK